MPTLVIPIPFPKLYNHWLTPNEAYIFKLTQQRNILKLTSSQRAVSLKIIREGLNLKSCNIKILREKSSPDLLSLALTPSQTGILIQEFPASPLHPSSPVCSHCLDALKGRKQRMWNHMWTPKMHTTVETAKYSTDKVRETCLFVQRKGFL